MDDNDFATLVVGAIPTLREKDLCVDLYYVKLGVQPTSDVVVRITVSNRDVHVDTDRDSPRNQDTLTFTRGNWDMLQQVCIIVDNEMAGGDDAINDIASFTHSVVDDSSADEFDGAPDVVQTVDVIDTDAKVTVSPKSLMGEAVDEGGSTSYSVKLGGKPASAVVITVSSSNMDVTVSPARLTFTRERWNRAQTVTVTADQDADAVDDVATITYSVVDDMSADEFDAAFDVPRTVRVNDDETAGVMVSRSSLNVTEGGSATYTVVLGVQPASGVVIMLSATIRR